MIIAVGVPGSDLGTTWLVEFIGDHSTLESPCLFAQFVKKLKWENAHCYLRRKPARKKLNFRKRIDTNFHVMLVIHKPKIKIFSSYPLVRLCIHRLWAPTSCASSMCFELRNISKVYCENNHLDIPYSK